MIFKSTICCPNTKTSLSLDQIQKIWGNHGSYSSPCYARNISLCYAYKSKVYRFFRKRHRPIVLIISSKLIIGSSIPLNFKNSNLLITMLEVGFELTYTNQSNSRYWVIAQPACPHNFFVGLKWVYRNWWAGGICMSKQDAAYIEAHPFLLKRKYFFYKPKLYIFLTCTSNAIQF